jgi:hypothetical protein
LLRSRLCLWFWLRLLLLLLLLLLHWLLLHRLLLHRLLHDWLLLNHCREVRLRVRLSPRQSSFLGGGAAAAKARPCWLNFSSRLHPMIGRNHCVACSLAAAFRLVFGCGRRHRCRFRDCRRRRNFRRSSRLGDLPIAGPFLQLDLPVADPFLQLPLTLFLPQHL